MSLDRLDAILDRLDREDIRMYRMSSSLVPYATHPDLPRFHGQVEECTERLARTGARIAAFDVRLSAHPSQYVVLNSERAETREAAARDLDLHARLFAALGLGAESVVVLHVGSGAGGREAARERFLRGLESLSPAARERLVIENDDRTFGLGAVLAIARETGLRVVWDVLHHHCHDPDGIPDAEALRLALSTWPDGQTPKVHYSSPRTAVEVRKVRAGRRTEERVVLPPLRAHADLVDPIAFEGFLAGPAAGLPFDVLLEAKAKDLALMRLREQLADRGISWDSGRLLAP